MGLSTLRHALFLVLIAFLVSAVGSAWAARMDESIPVEEYWTLLENSQQVIDDLKGQPEEDVPLGLDELAATWETVESVQLESGDTLPLDNSLITSALRAEEPDLNKLAKLFNSLLAARKTHPDPRFTARDIQPLDEILARPEFAWPEEQPNPINDWLQKFWDRVFAWLDKILPDNVSIDLTPIAAIALVLVLLFAFRSLFVELISDARIKSNGNPGDDVLTADSAFQRAQSLSRGGDYRSAVRYLYLSSLLLLDERGLLRYDRTRTNHEYLRTVKNKPELAQPLSEVIEVFDNVWYGYHELDEERFKHYSNRVEELKEKKQ